MPIPRKEMKMEDVLNEHPFKFISQWILVAARPLDFPEIFKANNETLTP
jgi:hypothetical protein